MIVSTLKKMFMITTRNNKPTKRGILFRGMALVCGLLLHHNPLLAQCKTAVLNINTGMNYSGTTPAPIPLGGMDPEWRIVNVSAATQSAAGIGAGPIIPRVASSAAWTPNSSTRSWISFNSNSAYVTTTGPVYTLTFRRQFTLCEPDEVRFDFKSARDNYISSITINGTPEFTEPATAAAPNFSNPPSTLALTSPVMTLPAGTYNIDIVVNNADVVHQANDHGLMLDGTVSSTTGKLTIRQNGYTTCDCDCSDKCYWKVQGNNILNGNNIFGTLTRDDVRIFTSNNARGIFTQGGQFGWNTMAPTAQLHVNVTGASPTTGIRFQGLLGGNDKDVLTVDGAGNVHTMPYAGSGNACGTINMLPKTTSATGAMNCSQVYDNGTSVGIGTTSGFTYSSLSGGRLGVTVPPSSGTVRFEVNGVERSLAEIVTSDANYKENINNIPDALGIIKDLTGHTFTWNNRAKTTLNADDGLHIGFIAQELQNVLPEIVISDDNGDLAVNYIEVIPLLTEAIKQQQQQIDQLTALVQSGAKAAPGNTTTSGNYLFQNAPNPFGSETTIEYRVDNMQQSAYIMIYDLNGKELRKYALAGKGRGKVAVSGNELQPGMYLYALVVDGKETDTKKMIVSK